MSTDNNNSRDPAALFPLFQFFVLTSVVVVASIAVVTWLHRNSEVQRLVHFAEGQNVALAKLFANTSWPELSPHVLSGSVLDGQLLRQRPATRDMHRIIQSASAGLSFIKVKIYDVQGRTVYSSDTTEIGETKTNNPGYFAAARDGRPASKLIKDNSGFDYVEAIQDRSVVESYLPIFNDGAVEGVFELYTDVTPLMTEIERDTQKLILGFVVAFGLVYAILFPIVRRADRTIRKQYWEITDKNAALQNEVADRKRAETALKLTIDNAPVGIVSLDLDGRITSANAAFCRMLRCSVAELTSKRVDEITHPSDREQTREVTGAVMASNRSAFAVKTRLLRSDAVVVHSEMHLALAVDSDGRPVQFIAQIADLSAKVELEKQIELQRQKLAHVGRLSTLGEMAAGIAHEMNQPLTAIATFADGCNRLISAGKDDPATLTDVLARISAQARRASEVIRRLRNMVGRGSMEKELADINDVVTEVLMLASTDTRIPTIRIETDMSDGLAPVNVDRIQIQQVLLNLLRNAMDAFDSLDDKRMSISVITATGGHSEITVSVVDRGKGVADDMVDYLFSPFYTTKTSGMGIGLSICQSIVQAHGGRLWYTPNPDRGSAFHFTLPCHAGSANG